MELKICGPSGAPDGDFQKDLQTLFTVSPDGWDVIAKWFMTTSSFDPNDALSSPAILASALVPEEFTASVGAIRYLLEAWNLYGLDLSDIQRDLMVLGFQTDQIERLGTLLGQLEPLRQPAYAELMRFQYENSVLPTLEDIDMVCDLRPIFENYVFPLPKKGKTSHTKLLGFSYMVLVELVAEDVEGQSHKLSFQMTESMLSDFKIALQRASDQLGILKESTRVLSNNS